MSRSYRIGFDNMVRSAKSSENAEMRRNRDRKPPPYEACCTTPKLPTYSEATRGYLTSPREPSILLLKDDGQKKLMRLGPRSSPVKCQYCSKDVLTMVVRVPMSSMNLGNFFTYTLCCCLPLCWDCDGSQMKKHYCPGCYNLIGVYKHKHT